MDKKQSQEGANEKQAQIEQRLAWIGKWLLEIVGRPSNLYQVQVLLLWEHHYRVNVLVGTDARSARIAHSYFLRADEEGQIVASTPEVAGRY